MKPPVSRYCATAGFFERPAGLRKALKYLDSVASSYHLAIAPNAGIRPPGSQSETPKNVTAVTDFGWEPI
jgi:hypothetical protein